MIYEKLMTIQQKLNAPKGQYNSFGKYKYRSCEDILQAVKPLLSETKTVLTVSDDIVEIGGRIYVVSTAKLVDTEQSDCVSVKGYAREEESKKGMDASQVTGASSSYARKYALNGLFAIDDNKDSDATNTGEQKQDAKSEKDSGKKQNEDANVNRLPKADADGFYWCEKCGKQITGAKLSNGKVIDPKQVCERVIKKYGAQLCGECCSKATVNLKNL